MLDEVRQKDVRGRLPEDGAKCTAVGRSNRVGVRTRRDYVLPPRARCPWPFPRSGPQSLEKCVLTSRPRKQFIRQCSGSRQRALLFFEGAADDHGSISESLDSQLIADRHPRGHTSFH